MKKLFGFILFALFAMAAVAQSKDQGSGDQQRPAMIWGVKGGLNLSKIVVKDDLDNYSESYKLNPGFHVGVTAEMPLTETFAFETGLLLSTKGFKMKESEAFDGTSYEYHATANLYYLDLPLTARKYFTIGGTRFFGTFGPYIGYGLSGKAKMETTKNGETESDEEDVKWGSGDNDTIKRLDFGLTAGAGLGLNALQFGVSYNLGLANIAADTSGGTTIHNQVIALSVGYQF